jgi:hypothetical protein
MVFGADKSADWLTLRSSQIRLVDRVFGSMLASQMDGRMGFPGTRKRPDPGQLYHRDLGSMLHCLGPNADVFAGWW